MTIAQLRYFLEICDCGSITGAAGNLFVSQQALSRTVTTLERELGAMLFLRSKKGIVLTQAGEVLRDQCRPVVKQFDEFSASVGRTMRTFSGGLRVCIFEDCLSLISMDDFDRFQAEYPQYTLELAEYPFQVCNRMLLSGAYDAALTLEPIQEKGIVNVPLQYRDLVMVVRRDSPLAQQDRVEERDIQGQRLVMSIDARGFEAVCQLCRQNDIEPEVMRRVSQLSGMFDLCSGNGYIGLTAEYSAEKLIHRYPSLVIKRFARRYSPYAVTLAYHQENGKQAGLDAFTGFLQSLSG